MEMIADTDPWFSLEVVEINPIVDEHNAPRSSALNSSSPASVKKFFESEVQKPCSCLGRRCSQR